MRHGYRMMQRALGTTIASAAMAVAVVFSLPGAAGAGGWLPPRVIVTASGPQPFFDDYYFRTTRPYWSVVAMDSKFISGSTQLDYDLNVLAGGTFLASSLENPPQIDFIAIDSNLRSPQGYTARARQFVGTDSGTQYTLEYYEGHLSLPIGRTTLPADANLHAYVADVFVWAGQTVHVTVAKDIPSCPTGVKVNYFRVFLMASNPDRPVQGRISRVAESGPITDGAPGPCGLTISHTAVQSGWHGLVIWQQGFERTLIDVGIQ